MAVETLLCILNNMPRRREGGREERESNRTGSPCAGVVCVPHVVSAGVPGRKHTRHVQHSAGEQVTK